jgi:hypothetical protein
MPSSLATAVDAVLRGTTNTSPLGLVLRLSRAHARDQWLAAETAFRPLAAAAVSETQVVAALACSLRLPQPTDGEGYRRWYDRVAPTQAIVLRSTQLFC